MKLLTIVPPVQTDEALGMPTRTQGTKVIDENGNEVPHVTGITLRADVNSVWKGVIETNALCLPPEGVRAECEFVHNFPHAEELIASIFRQIIDGVGHKPTGLTVEYDESGEVLLGVKII